MLRLSRLAAEIQGRRRVLQGELASENDHLWIADQVTRIAWRQKLAEDLEVRLADEDLDPRLRVRYAREINALLRNVAEEKGELRNKLEVATTQLTDFSVIALDENGQFHGVTDC